jgi:hypothetical protein
MLRLAVTTLAEQEATPGSALEHHRDGDESGILGALGFQVCGYQGRTRHDSTPVKLAADTLPAVGIVMS